MYGCNHEDYFKGISKVLSTESKAWIKMEDTQDEIVDKLPDIL